MQEAFLKEYRCACNKLLFKGYFIFSEIEIKCKRCGMMRTFKESAQGPRSFMFVVDNENKVVDACEGVVAIEYNRQYVLGKLLFDILPLARDAQYEEIMSNSENYQIKNNTLFLRDRKIPIESHIIPINSGGKQLYRVFNVINNS